MDVLTTKRPRPRVPACDRARARVLAVAALLLVLAAPACYTLVQHPGIARRNYTRPAPDTPCLQCHSRTELRAFLAPERLAKEQGPWEQLNHPWWYDAMVAADSAAADSTKAGTQP